jgi:murein DD-endopeptidase MepM/ murein hydrolase activator NlpD
VLLLAAPIAGAAELGSRQLRVGSHGDDVLQLQSAMRRLGYGLTADGVFGRQTARSVRRYERRHHMKADGVVGSREARKIMRESSTGGTAPPDEGQTAGGGQPPQPPPDKSPPPDGEHVFPVVGPYSFGGDGSRFGAPRGNHTHQGQDVAAAEGQTLVSVSNGTVYWRAYQAAAAGNYVVIRGSDGYDYAYMHLREGSLVDRGEHVDAGDPIGHVGQTGDAQGPHLHFEVWDGHWQDGGHPIDPLPMLRAWASASR